MRADIHDGREQKSSKERPDTLMQDRTARSTKPLAPHGRTIHMGQSLPHPDSTRRNRCRLRLVRDQIYTVLQNDVNGPTRDFTPQQIGGAVQALPAEANEAWRQSSAAKRREKLLDLTSQMLGTSRQPCRLYRQVPSEFGRSFCGLRHVRYVLGDLICSGGSLDNAARDFLGRGAMLLY